MKFNIPYLHLGEMVVGEVVENLPGNELLINFNGDLVRVSNESTKTFRRKEKIELIVTALKPLQFRFATHQDSTGKKPLKLDVSI